jgi:hypothetical protein
MFSLDQRMDTYEIVAAALYILRFPLAAVAIALCVFLFRRTRSVGWLFLSVLFVEPFWTLAIRFAHGRPLLQYRTMGPSTGGSLLAVSQPSAANMTIHFDVPTFYICAVIGLFLLARGVKRERQV